MVYKHPKFTHDLFLLTLADRSMPFRDLAGQTPKSRKDWTLAGHVRRYWLFHDLAAQFGNCPTSGFGRNKYNSRKKKVEEKEVGRHKPLHIVYLPFHCS
ncbi:hypothetical protein TNCT_463671 [Trichonephila clavata]|uniref:Uncharacterized protein n=1 Tax=Trichonephila clavata TaxID=2740835 RepID=A0A8X6G2J3_TRICU|nr:hypothetical protein TNCT_463671 [Trichonephila clavata]